MRILIGQPQIPFVHGGTELLCDTLASELRRRGHEAELLRLPFKWYPPERLLLDSLAWRQFDLTAGDGKPVDLFIGTKFPSYLARHPNKVLWLFHQHRPLYDRFGLPDGDGHFQHTAEGNSARAALVAADREALAECRGHFTISRNVSRRLRNYCGVESETLYPPPRGADHFFSAEHGDYLLYVGRLDEMKRIDLLLNALPGITRDLRVVIAGRGPDEGRLRSLAARLGIADRVVFSGFVPEASLYPLYAGARAVYYAPVDEDYGFATIEAHLSARPVVTCDDAGGVLEFVTDGETGVVAAPEPGALAQRINELAAGGPRRAAEMGERGRERARKLGWESVLDGLLGGGRA